MKKVAFGHMKAPSETSGADRFKAAGVGTERPSRILAIRAACGPLQAVPSCAKRRGIQCSSGAQAKPSAGNDDFVGKAEEAYTPGLEKSIACFCRPGSAKARWGGAAVGPPKAAGLFREQKCGRARAPGHRH